MPLTKDQKDSLLQGFMQLGIGIILYLSFSLVGFITAILIGFILPEIISPYIQGAVILLTQVLGGYFAIKVFQTDIERLE